MSLDNRDYMRDSDSGSGPDIFATLTPYKIILVVNIAIFVLQHMFGLWMTPIGPNRFIEQGGLSLVALSEGHVWTVVTHMFVHGDLMHLIFNMAMIWFTSRSLEAILGPKSYLFLYFFAGLVAAGLQLAFYRFVLFADSPADFMNATMIGASGAGFGLLLAYATILPEQQLMLIFPIPMRISARNLGRAALIITIGIVIYQVLFGEAGGIAHVAHLGGAIAGLLFARFLGFGGASRTSGGSYGGTYGSTFGAPNPGPPAEPKRKSWFKKSPPSSKVIDAKVVATEDFVSAEIDPILDKINKEGMGSLTEKERKILERGQRKISKKVDGK